MSILVRHLEAEDLDLLDALCTVFGEAFEDAERYTAAKPGADYWRRLLGNDHFIALVATKEDLVVGGIVAYELPKYERAYSEIYLYDLAVAGPHRREGIATALIEALQEIAEARGAQALFVQADTEEEDEPAIALYTQLGEGREVLHFDLPIGRRR